MEHGKPGNRYAFARRGREPQHHKPSVWLRGTVALPQPRATCPVANAKRLQRGAPRRTMTLQTWGSGRKSCARINERRRLTQEDADVRR